MRSDLGEAIRFMRELHKGQRDKCGLPYWRHPLRVMKSLYKEMKWAGLSELFKQKMLLVALFHDVFEDVKNGEVWLEEFLKNKFPTIKEDVLQSIRLLTRPKKTLYSRYVASVLLSNNPYANCVKLADIRSNCERLHLIEDKELRNRLANKYRVWTAFCNAIQKRKYAGA